MHFAPFLISWFFIVFLCVRYSAIQFFCCSVCQLFSFYVLHDCCFSIFSFVHLSGFHSFSFSYFSVRSPVGLCNCLGLLLITFTVFRFSGFPSFTFLSMSVLNVLCPSFNLLLLLFFVVYCTFLSLLSYPRFVDFIFFNISHLVLFLNFMFFSVYQLFFWIPGFSVFAFCSSQFPQVLVCTTCLFGGCMVQLGFCVLSFLNMCFTNL